MATRSGRDIAEWETADPAFEPEPAAGGGSDREHAGDRLPASATPGRASLDGRPGSLRPGLTRPSPRLPEVGKATAKPGAGKAPKNKRPAKAAGRTRFRSGRLSRKVKVLAGLSVAAAIAVTAFIVLRPPPAHVISVPAALGGYLRQPTGADATAEQLRSKIVASASGEVKNVVAAVYERKTGPGTSTGPQVIIFIGGNLAGSASQSSLISAIRDRLNGAFTTSPGPLGGQAACAPGSNGGLAECAWADGDTFGVIVSATLSATSLASEMRTMRPLVEHIAR